MTQLIALKVTGDHSMQKYFSFVPFLPCNSLATSFLCHSLSIKEEERIYLVVYPILYKGSHAWPAAIGKQTAGWIVIFDAKGRNSFVVSASPEGSPRARMLGEVFSIAYINPLFCHR